MVVEHLRASPARAESTPKPDHTDAYAVGFDDGLTQATRDISITHAHRTALRRILAGEPVGDLGHLLGALYLHELVDDDLVNRLPFVTPLGVELLAAHDRLAATVRRERPRLTSRPLPAGWRVDASDGRLWHEEHGAASNHDELEGDVRYYRAMAAAYEWLLHERAVRAQDGAS